MCKLSYEEVKFVEVQDWDKLVESVYKRPYSFQQQYGCQERGIYRFSTDDIIPVSEMQDYYSNEIPEEVNGEEMGVSFEAWLKRDPKQPIVNQGYDWELGLFWERNFYPDVEIVIADLYEKGYLEDGDYIINIDW